MKLNQHSKELITFMRLFGWFLFNRFPIELKCAQDEFQRAMFENFGDTKNVLLISNDTTVYEFSGSDHDSALNELFERARKINWKFNPDELRIDASTCIMLGDWENKAKSKDGIILDRDQLRHGYEMPSMPETRAKHLNRDSTTTWNPILPLAIHKYWSFC